MSQVQITNWDIAFDKHELIVNVIQVLALSTASLVQLGMADLGQRLLINPIPFLFYIFI